jgi:Neuraminidase (sialidase)
MSSVSRSKLFAGIAVLLAVVMGLAWWTSSGTDAGRGAVTGASTQRGEADEVGDADFEIEKGRARQEAALASPQLPTAVLAAPATGWSGQSLFNATGNDWEPAVAAGPNGQVYVLTTRYGGTKACKTACPDPALILRSSSDNGKTWGGESYICVCKNVKAQNDPELVVVSNGTVYAAWMNDWKIVFSKSTDKGKTWSAPVAVVGNLSWSDKPIMTASPDGKNVFIAFNKSDAYVAVSRDFGATWTQVVTEANGRYHFANGGVFVPGGTNGTVVFSEVAYAQDSTGPSTIQIHRSTDNGATWRVITVDTAQEMYHCVSSGCGIDYYGPQAVVGADANGKLVLAYNANTAALQPQRAYVRTSTDGGSTWSARSDVTGSSGSGSGSAGVAFPAIAGTGNGSFRMFYMEDRNGTSGWNTRYVSSSDGGTTWSAPVNLSDATSGPSYVGAQGFAQPYGDYGQIAVRSDGGTIAVWGEGVSYTGPGGTWINRTTP